MWSRSTALKKNRLLSEHDMIAIMNRSQVIAVGNDAFEMYEKNPPNIRVDRPMVNGRIADVAEVEMLLRLLLRKTDRRSLAHPLIFFSTPVNMSEIEKRAYYAISDAGNPRNPRVFLVDRPICDAISLGIDIERTKGSMILDIGAQSTEVSVIAGGQVIVSDTLAIGGQQLNDAIYNEIRRSRNLLIGKRTARRLKSSLATFLQTGSEERLVTGVDTLTGLPRQETIPGTLVQSAVTDEMKKGAEAMRTFLERTPPQISGNVFNEGIYLTGGTSRIPGIERYLCRVIGCRINLGKDYEFSTVKGLEEVMLHKELRKWASSVKDRK